MNVWFGLLLISLHWSAVFLESTITDPSGSVDRGIESAITDPSGSVDGGIESAITDPSGSVDRGIESAITDPSGSGDGDDIFGTTANIDSNKDSLAITASYSNEETNYNFSASIAEIKPCFITFRIDLSLPNQTECQQINVSQSADVSSEVCDQSGIHVIQTTKLNIGSCYNLTITIGIKTADKTDKTIGPQYYYSCTKPKPPEVGSKVLNRTANSLTVQIEHPGKGTFDSFEININGINHAYDRSRDENTVVELSNLQPGECYNVTIYTVLKGEKSNNPRDLPNECLYPSSPGKTFTVVYNISSFTITWTPPAGYYDQFLVAVKCQSAFKYSDTVKLNSSNVFGVTPGDCCRVEVTTQSHQLNSTPQLYYVHVNESVPDRVIIKNVSSSKSQLFLGWTQPVKTNGWILGYRVKMYNNMRKQMYTIDINCTEGQGSCSEMFTQQMFQCSKYNLTNDRSQAKFQMTESSFNLTIHGLQPGLMYYYSIVAFNAKGSSSTGERNISTLEDTPQPPASISLSVLNTTSINMSWTPPDHPNGVLISYKVYAIIGRQFVNKSVGTDKTSVVLSDLDCWTQYNVCVSAINSVGFSQGKCDRANTTVYKPKSQIKSVVSVGSSSLSVDFVIPCESDKKIPIHYNISYTTMGHKDSQQQSTNITEWKECFFKEKCNITGLYSFWDYYIKAQESIGSEIGPWSDVWNITTLASLPEPPAGINISVLNTTSMNVTWSPPNKPNGALISYNVSYAIIGGRFVSRTVGVDETSVLLSGLNCWTPYIVCVSALNSVGFSQDKCDQANTTVYKPMSKVKRAEASGSSSILLEFEIPCDSVNIPIHYNILYYCYSWVISHNDSQQSSSMKSWAKCDFKKTCEITGLYSYCDYNIQVKEKVGNQIGRWSDVLTVRTHASLPEPPASINIFALNTTSMNVSWSPPNKPNGVLISYKVSYAIIGGQFVSRTVGVNMTSVLLSGLKCWTQYNVCVSANNSVGFGEDLCDSANTTAYEPKSEIKSVVALGSSSVSLDFVIPCNYSQIPISYNVSYTTMSHECSQQNLLNITDWQECSFQESCEIKSLYSFWDYFIQVQERFRGNFGNWSKVFPVQTHKNYPDEVINLEIKTCTPDSLTVCWDVPCFLNGHFVKYEITLDGQTRTTGTETCSTIDALMPYTYYNISVTVVNDFGRSQALDVVGRTDIAKPSKPNIIKIHIDSRKVKVDWSPLNLYPGPTNYTVEVKDVESGIISSCYSSSFNLTTCTVDGLEEYWPYEVTVTARTKKGENSSVIRSMHTLGAAPGPVTNFSVKPEMNPENPRQIYVKFLAPERRNQNGVLNAYYIICKVVQSGEIISVTKLEREAETKIPVPHQLLLNISVFGETIENGTVVFRTVIVPEGAKDFPVAGAVAGMLTAVVFIVVAVIIAIFYRKQMFCFKAPTKVKEAIGMNAVKPKKKTSGENVDKRKNRPIKNDRFYQHVEIMARDSNNFFAKEYKELKDLAPNLPTEAAQQQDARAKNRYSNILPFDHSRVKLLPFDDDEGSDYINANYIPGFNSQREYIATQGPLPSTKDDFWRMIWEQNVSVIVMLTQCVERGKRKCECYWPECVREPVYFGDLCIETETESHLPEYVLRTMKISLGNVTKCITHFLYLAWPDMGVPSSTDSMISLVKTVRSHVNPSMKGPMTVHCSAGVGRTGTFIAVDILLHKLDSDYNQMDIFGDVLTLRNYRCNMVQTEDQYIFIHHCISDYILALSEETDEEEAADGGDEPVYQNVIKK